MGNAACCGEQTKNGIVPSVTFDLQNKRPLRVVLVRHGQSEGNVKRDVTKTTPDHLIHLTQQGREEALQTGRNLKSLVGSETIKFIVSPYVRTQETMNGIAFAFGGRSEVDTSEDPFIREQDFGNFESGNMKELHKEKKAFGKFYYRFPEGESPADVYNRAGIFLETMYRRWETYYVDNLVIVSHELFIIVFLMRMFRWPVRDFYAFEDVKNCTLVVLEREGSSIKFSPSYTWVPGGVKVPGSIPRKPTAPAEEEIWDGRPESALIQSLSRKKTQ